MPINKLIKNENFSSIFIGINPLSQLMLFDMLSYATNNVTYFLKIKLRSA